MPLHRINFMDWYQQATPAEKSLYDKADSFSDLFDDMLFREGATTFELIQCQSQDPESGDWEDDTAPVPDDLAYFNLSRFRYKVEELEEGCEGATDFLNQTITVSPEALHDDSVILHELIHAHEYVLNELELYYHDAVLWALYEDLKHKIPNLDELITSHTHLMREYNIFMQGGSHDILFLLKSFDLDLRMGYPLGKVFGYGRKEEYKAAE